MADEITEMMNRRLGSLQQENQALKLTLRQSLEDFDKVTGGQTTTAETLKQVMEPAIITALAGAFGGKEALGAFAQLAADGIQQNVLDTKQRQKDQAGRIEKRNKLIEAEIAENPKRMSEIENIPLEVATSGSKAKAAAEATEASKTRVAMAGRPEVNVVPNTVITKRFEENSAFARADASLAEMEKIFSKHKEDDRSWLDFRTDALSSRTEVGKAFDMLGPVVVRLARAAQPGTLSEKDVSIIEKAVAGDWTGSAKDVYQALVNTRKMMTIAHKASLRQYSKDVKNFGRAGQDGLTSGANLSAAAQAVKDKYLGNK